jgi:hypothetical protein
MQSLIAALNLLLIVALLLGLIEIFGDGMVAVVALFLSIAAFAWLTGMTKTKKSANLQVVTPNEILF